VGETSVKRLAAYLHAERRLARAHAALDDMMQSVPCGAAEEATGRPGLLLLLFRAVAARRHLNDVGAALELERAR